MNKSKFSEKCRYLIDRANRLFNAGFQEESNYYAAEAKKYSSAEFTRTNETEVEVDIAIEMETLMIEPRGHLGFSVIGNDDTRTTWLQWRWSLPREINARIQRIFKLGHILEGEVINILRLTGATILEIDPVTKKQWVFAPEEFGGHFGGSMDGAIQGLAETPDWAVLEVKSMKDQFWKILYREGLKKFSSAYWGQCQCYMKASGMKIAFFIAYNKNTSEIYTEIVHIELYAWEGYLSRAENLITREDAPASTYSSRDYFEIKQYKSKEYRAVYWGDQLPPKAHCRNCLHSSPVTNFKGGSWLCKRTGEFLSNSKQWAGCNYHLWLPCFVKNDSYSINDDNESVDYVLRNKAFKNIPGTKKKNNDDEYSSNELISLSKGDWSILEDENIKSFCDEFDAKIEITKQTVDTDIGRKLPWDDPQDAE